MISDKVVEVSGLGMLSATARPLSEGSSDVSSVCGVPSSGTRVWPTTARRTHPPIRACRDGRFLGRPPSSPPTIGVVEGGPAVLNDNPAMNARDGRVGKPHGTVEPPPKHGLLLVVERQLGAAIGPTENSESKVHWISAPFTRARKPASVRIFSRTSPTAAP